MDQQLQTILTNSTNKNVIGYDELPDIDLYMDQILSFVDIKLENHKSNPQDKLLTKTMINNYSKEGIISKVQGKKYSKDQILQMLLVYHLKNGLSMQELKTLFVPLHHDHDNLQQIYSSFTGSKPLLNPLIDSTIDELLAISNHNTTLLIMNLIALSNTLQEISKELIKDIK